MCQESTGSLIQIAGHVPFASHSILNRFNCMVKKISSDADSVKNYIECLDDPQTASDCHVLIEMMQRITGQRPKIWNVGTIGFDTYHYKYDSGREGDCQAMGFYARKGMITVYLMDGTIRHAELLGKLGKHTGSRVCIYIKRLADIQLPILEQIVSDSYTYIKALDGQMHKALT